jgi:hypothetical protein
MFTLSDLMRAAQGGAAMNNMAHQFGLSLEQTQRAMEALMPAFAMAFRRNATDPMGFSALMRMMGSGRYADFFDQPGQAFTPFGMSQGNDIVAQLFGPEAARRVAEQTAAWAGIAPEIMKQMLPVTAAMLMGGLFRSAATEGLADFFERLADALRGKDPQRPAQRGETPSAGAMPNPFQFWAGLMGGLGETAPAPRKPAETSPEPRDAPPSPFGPWGDMLNAMLAAGQPPAPPPEPEPEPEPASPANPMEFFGHMFETGMDAQQQHLASLRNIFDTYWGADHKRQ